MNLRVLQVFGGVFLCFSFASGLSCYKCTSGSYVGETNDEHQCFDSQTNGNDFHSNCTNNEQYCRTKFGFINGVVDAVSRSCIDPTYDQDDSSYKIPSHTECVTDLNDSNDRTTCYHSCNKENCNDIGIESLSPCQGNCSAGDGHGECDYFKGECVCKDVWSGSNCDVAQITYQKCFQCSSETNGGCESLSEISKETCPDINQQYCTVTKTITYDESNNLIRTAITRGCTQSSYSLNEEECTLSRPNDSALSRYNEYHCTATCDTEGCNTGIPNGIIDSNEGSDLYCVQCSGVQDCNKQAERCPSGSNFCKSTVQYFISNATTSLLQPDEPSYYKILSVVRGCAQTAVEKSCASRKLESSNVDEVTCMETCAEDGCNTGWPARPLCSQCRGDSCEEYPSIPESCDSPYQAYCTIQQVNTDKLKGFPSSTERRCSYYDETECSFESYGSSQVRFCKRSCTTDGCNLGLNAESGATIFKPSIFLSFFTLLWSLRI